MAMAENSISNPITPQEFSDVAEKILCNINTVFEKDELLDEFDIIHQEIQANKSPIVHLNHKLALESWCVPYLYTHSYKQFLALRSNSNISSDSAIDEISAPKLHPKFSKQEKTNRINELSRILVLLNPDLTVAWNSRREAFSNKFLCTKDELKLIAICLTRKPKCSECFHYRRWILNESILNGTIDLTSQVFRNEANTANHAAIKYFSNYHAWNYRIFLLTTWMNAQYVPQDLKNEIISTEKHLSDAWITAHISDYCGFHYRQKLFEFILKRKKSDESKVEFMCELKENRAMILFYPGHESLWYHRRFIFNLILKFLSTESLEEESDRNALFECEYELVRLISTKVLESNSEAAKTSAGQITGYLVTNNSVLLNNKYSILYSKWLFNLQKKYNFS